MLKKSLSFFCLFCCSMGFAFNTIPYHGDITIASMNTFAFGNEAQLLFRAAVIAPDRDDGTYRGTYYYTHQHHCDRPVSMTSKAAFIDCIKYYYAQRDLAVFYGKQHRIGKEIAALGRALHVIQDFNSHSNYIDLSKEKQEAINQVIFKHGRFNLLPKDLKLTSFEPSDINPGVPAKDVYPHDLFSKDAPKKNAEAQKLIGDKTKFQVAYDSAIGMSFKTVTWVLDQLKTKEQFLIKHAKIYSVYPPLPDGCYSVPDSISDWRKGMLDCTK